MSAEFRAFLQLAYSLCKQYIAWYEKEIKTKPVVSGLVPTPVYKPSTEKD